MRSLAAAILADAGLCGTDVVGRVRNTCGWYGRTHFKFPTEVALLAMFDTEVNIPCMHKL